MKVEEARGATVYVGDVVFFYAFPLAGDRHVVAYIDWYPKPKEDVYGNRSIPGGGRSLSFIAATAVFDIVSLLQRSDGGEVFVVKFF